MTIKPLKISLNEWGGIVTWLAVFVITLIAMNNASWEVKIGIYQVICLFIIYLFCFIFVVNESIGLQNSNLKLSLYILQLLSAFLLNFYISFGFLPILTVIWVSILPSFVNYRCAFIITFLTVLSWNLLDWYIWRNDEIIYSSLLYFTFHLFAVSMTVNAITAEKEREKAEKLNKELQSTQLLLGEASRQNERTRIARDLHDLLGHHLTALLINLQIAEHTSEGTVKENISKCHSLAKLLMSDVRESIANIREYQTLNFSQMLNKMIEAVPKLKFQIDIDYEFVLDDIEIAKQLLSCIQEAITNSLKHSQAKEFYLSIKNIENKLVVEISDDGNCSQNIKLGHGLYGIKERIELINGTVKHSVNKNTFRLTFNIPLQSK